nr:hypothetical protein [Tanacetum cinerariifolium]
SCNALVPKPHHEMSSAALWHLPSFVLLPIRNSISQAPEEVCILQADAQSIPIPTEPSTFKPQKKHKPKRKHTKEPEVPPTESQAEHNLPSPSYDPLPSGEDSLKLKELMGFCTNLSNKVLDLESGVIDIKSTYQARIEKLERRVDRLKEENMVLKELMGVHSKLDSDKPVMKKEESSKQERKITDIDADVKINLEKVQAEVYNLDLDHQEKVLSMLDVNDEETADVEEVLEVVTTAKQVQIKLDEEVARQLKAELNADVDWNVVIEQVEKREKLTDAKHYNYNQAFLNEVNEEVKVPEREVRQEKEVKVESSKRECESLEKEVAKKQKMKQETEELKKHLQIIPNDDDDVYIDATPLASKISIIDYKIHTKRNRPCFKIIRADGNHRCNAPLRKEDVMS